MDTSKSYLSSNDERIVIIDGSLCETIDNFYDTVGYQLALPEYFGRNLDGFEDLLFDLEWVEEEKVHFIIINEGAFIPYEPEIKGILLDILSNKDLLRVKLTLLSC